MPPGRRIAPPFGTAPDSAFVSLHVGVSFLISTVLRSEGVAFKTRGRPWPREREGPTSVAQWEGWSEAEGFESNPLTPPSS